MKKVFLISIIIFLSSCNRYSPNKLFNQKLNTLENNVYDFISIKDYKITSIFFLYPDCPMCINYSYVINNINTKLLRGTLLAIFMLQLIVAQDIFICCDNNQNIISSEAGDHLSIYAADFDGDSDLDIAVTSFYADYASDAPEVFTYLENQGSFQFVPYSSALLNEGRWMSMDIGDIDGDQDVDIVLGGGYLTVGLEAYPEVIDRLTESGESVLILKNTLN